MLWLLIGLGVAGLAIVGLALWWACTAADVTDEMDTREDWTDE